MWIRAINRIPIGMIEVMRKGVVVLSQTSFEDPIEVVKEERYRIDDDLAALFNGSDMIVICGMSPEGGEVEETAEREDAFVESSRRTIMDAFVCGLVPELVFDRSSLKLQVSSCFPVAERKIVVENAAFAKSRLSLVDSPTQDVSAIDSHSIPPKFPVNNPFRFLLLLHFFFSFFSSSEE